jgi:hypothetical protein
MSDFLLTRCLCSWIQKFCLTLALLQPTIAVLGRSEDVVPNRIDLAGEWAVVVLPEGSSSQNIQQGHEATKIMLPGALHDARLGTPVGPDTKWIADSRPELLKRPEFSFYQTKENFKSPFWLQPDYHFVGTAEYTRVVEIPDKWKGKRISLDLERPHWRTTVLVDGKLIGDNESLSIPHHYDLSEVLEPGIHTLAIRVDNTLRTLDVGLNSHSVSDHTQGAWNGIIGDITLSVMPEVLLHDIRVKPNLETKSVNTEFTLVAPEALSSEVSVAAQVWQHGHLLGSTTVSLEVERLSDSHSMTIPLSVSAKTWDEFKPNLCELRLSLVAANRSEYTQEVTFGFRQLKTRRTQFELNGQPVFFRGALDCCIFPLTGYPPTDVASWKRIINTCKDYGLNHLRFHSWCPPKAAFVAADELGFYFQVECSSWPNQSTSVGDNRDVDAWLYREADRILATYGNHPSFMLFAMGNEPGGPENGGKYLRPWVSHFKSKAWNQIVTGGSGWPSIVENGYHVTPLPRIQQWGQELTSRINAIPPATTADYRDFVNQCACPVISHEIGQWCVFPNLREMTKYKGIMKPRNFEIFEELLRKKNLDHQAYDFFLASGKLQALTYKEEIESALRTPGFGGFQLLGLQDFPGQGTALVGVVDPFWEPKDYISAEEYRKFCAPIVPLARMEKRTFLSNETFTAKIELSNFGPASLHSIEPTWRVLKNNVELGKGILNKIDTPIGSLSSLGSVEFPLQQLKEACELTLEIELMIPGQENPISNSWKFWCYPVQLPPEQSNQILVAEQLDQAALKHLDNGGSVVLMVDPASIKNRVRIGFSPIFWSTAWTGGQAPHTLGILCDPTHFALQDFPTAFHSDWQWWDIISRSNPINLDSIDKDLKPIVQVVPDWFDPQKLGLVFEARLGNGKLLVCSVDLKSDLEKRPAAKQLRHSLMKYANSENFNPPTSIDAESVKRVLQVK